jgi:1-acyl-sn-glycerol-3-phosphate acyltransferase
MRNPRLRLYRKRHIPRWPRVMPVRWIRHALLSGIVFPILRLWYSLRVYGRENIRAVNRPALVISNHNMHLDQAMILRSLPPRFRERLAVAAAATDIYGNRWSGFWASLLANGFPFNKEGSGVRESLETVAQMLDEGWHVLIFPEGKLTVMGPMQRFKAGTGYLAVETGVPVLPMRIDVVRPGIREGRWLPTPRAKVEVHIGTPVTFEPGTSYAEATAVLEQAVREA